MIELASESAAHSLARKAAHTLLLLPQEALSSHSTFSCVPVALVSLQHFSLKHPHHREAHRTEPSVEHSCGAECDSKLSPAASRREMEWLESEEFEVFGYGL